MNYDEAIQIIDNMFMTVKVNGDYDSDTVDRLLIPIRKILVASKKEHELLGHYKEVDRFFRTATKTGDYNDVCMLYREIREIERRLKCDK